MIRGGTRDTGNMILRPVGARYDPGRHGRVSASGVNACSTTAHVIKMPQQPQPQPHPPCVKQGTFKQCDQMLAESFAVFIFWHLVVNEERQFNSRNKLVKAELACLH